MNPTDAILLLVLIVAAVRGAVRGFLAETFGLLAIVLGLAGGALLAPALAEFLGAKLHLASPLLEVAAYVGGFFALHLPVLLLGILLGGVWKRGLAGVVNRAGGLVVGSLKWTLVLALFLVALDAAAGRDALPGRDASRLAAVLEEALTIPLRVGDERGAEAEG
jgi:membrane protein required for colicin V production